MEPQSTSRLLSRPSLEALFSTLLVTLVGLILSAVGHYVAQPELEVFVGDAVAAHTTGETSQVPVTVTNRRDEDVSNLLLEISDRVDLSQIRSSRALRLSIDKSARGGGSLIVRIDGLPGKAVTTLLLPVPTPFDRQSIHVHPPRGVRTVLQSYGSVEGRLEIAAKSAFLSVLINSVIYFFVAWVFLRFALPKVDALREEADRIGNELKKNNLEIDQIRKLQSELEARASSRLGRVKALLVARLSDTNRELQFWRGVIREMVIRRGGSDHDLEELTSLVTERLGTWGAHRHLPDSTALRIAAALLERGDAELRSIRQTSFGDPESP